MLRCCLLTARYFGGSATIMGLLRYVCSERGCVQGRSISTHMRTPGFIGNNRDFTAICRGVHNDNFPVSEGSVDDPHPDVETGLTSIPHCASVSLTDVIEHSTSPRHSPNGQTAEILRPESAETGSSADHSTLAITTLLDFLSQSNLTSSNPKLLSVNKLQSFYNLAKAHSQLSRLSSSHFSTLISLLGSLSVLTKFEVSSPPVTSEQIFSTHPIVARMEERAFRSHWSFFAVVIDDKKQFGHKLNDTDNFWLMRHMFDKIKGLLQQQASDDISLALKQYVRRARTYYLRIRRPHADWQVHINYLEGLYSTGDPQDTNEVVMRMANLLNWHGVLHRRLVALFWQILSQPVDTITESSKFAFLSALRSKINKQINRTTALLGGTPHGEDQRKDDNGSSTWPFSRFDAKAIRETLTQVLFSHHSEPITRKAPFAEIYSWALWEARVAIRAFAGTVNDNQAETQHSWNNLVLLSLSYGSGRNSGPLIQAFGDGHNKSATPLQIVDWTLVSALVTLEELMTRLHRTKPCCPDQRHVPEGATAMVRTIWVLWRQEGGERSRPATVNCCALVTFMRLATVFRDTHLKDGLVRYIGDAIVTPTLLGDILYSPFALQSVAVEYAIMATIGGLRTWKDILDAVWIARLGPTSEDKKEWWDTVANLFLVELARHNFLLAHDLYLSAATFDMGLEVNTIVALGKAAAYNHQLGLALVYLADPRISGHMARELLDLTLLELSRTEQNRFESRTAKIIMDIIVKATTLSHLPSHTQAFEWTLITIMKSGYSSQATEAVLNVLKTYSLYFSPSFLKKFIATLVAQRRYRLIVKLTKSISPMHPRFTIIMRTILPGVDFFSGDFRLEQLTPRSFPFLRHDSPLLSRLNRFNHRWTMLKRRIITLKLIRQVTQPTQLNALSLERAIYMLVRIGRLRAAMRLLKGVTDKNLTTKAGNIILSGSLLPRRSRRNERQIRHMNHRLQHLIDKMGFIPDRVTLNLTIKARLRWDHVTDSMMARRLFDRLVLSGYPGGRGRKDPRGPFGTGSPGTSQKPNQLSSTISFKRHTRPLYRMFIKAFYLRGDREAAARVASILQVARAESVAEIMRRERSRQMGRVKALARRQGSSEPAAEQVIDT